MAKILYSPRFGSGWSTVMTEGGHDSMVFALSYKPLIEALESGSEDRKKDAVAQFECDYEAKFGHPVYTGGARDLAVAEVTSSFRIDEYDGRESIIMRDDTAWFVPVGDEIV